MGVVLVDQHGMPHISVADKTSEDTLRIITVLAVTLQVVRRVAEEVYAVQLLRLFL